MNSLVKYIVSITLLYGISACRRQSLEDPHGSLASIPISIDWSSSNLDLSSVDNISIYIYPKDGSSPYVTISSNIDSVNISLPAGDYSALIFSGVVGNLTGIRFIDSDSYQGFYVEAKSDTSTDLYYQTAATDTTLLEIETLAAWRLDDLEVEGELITCSCSSDGWGGGYSSQLLGVVPTPVTATTTVTVKVENLNSASYIEGVLKGFSKGANLSTNNRIESENSLYICDFQNRTYDDSSTQVDGTTTCSIITFGKQPTGSATYQLELNIIIASGEKLTYQRDVTSQVEESEDFNIVINLTDSTSMISLPESSTSGFGVESWGTGQQVDLL